MICRKLMKGTFLKIVPTCELIYLLINDKNWHFFLFHRKKRKGLHLNAGHNIAGARRQERAKGKVCLDDDYNILHPFNQCDQRVPQGIYLMLLPMPRLDDFF
jgi:hypothetical protein